MTQAHPRFSFRHNKSTVFSRFIACFLLALPLLASSETSEQRGRAIFEEIDRRDLGFADFSSRQEMVLRNQSGQESRRVMDNTVLEGDTDGDKVLIVFREPKHIRGTALLTHAHRVGNDDQWLYLPALGRVKRISGASRAGSFVGSEFAYEDLSPQEVDDYTYQYLGDDTLGDHDCYKVVRTPTDPDSGYTRQIVWVDKSEYRIYKIEFYDRKQALIKVLTVSGYKKYLDKYWRPGHLSMINQLDGKMTEMIASDYVFRQGLSDEDFNENSLRRVR